MKLHILVPLLLLGTSLSAQQAEAGKAPDPDQVLARAITKMSSLKSITFRTTESQDAAMTRAIMKQVGGAIGLPGAGEVDVSGSFAGQLLRATLNDDADEVLVYRGRMIARNDDIGWKLRRNRLAAGNPMPFVLDPTRFFEALAAIPKPAREIKHHANSTYKDKPVLVVGLTLEGEAAQDFALSGALPSVSAGLGGGAAIMRMAGIGGVKVELPELTVDLALYVEPTTDYIHKIKTRTYQKSDAAAGIRMQIQGAGLGGEDEEEEEEAVKEKDASGKRIYKRGLPVRALKDDLSEMSYDIILTRHGQALERKLDDRAKQLLRLDQ